MRKTFRGCLVCLTPQLSLVTFSAHSGHCRYGAGRSCGGADRVHGRGERPPIDAWLLVWNMIALDPVQFEQYGRALPESLSVCHRREKSRVPSPAIWRACDAACASLSPRRDKAQITGAYGGRARHRASLIQTLVACLTGASMRATGLTKRRHARIMIRFEEVAEHLSEPLYTTQLCELIGVTSGTLRSCCAEFLACARPGTCCCAG